MDTKFIGQTAIEKVDDTTIKVMVNPCGAPMTDVFNDNVIPEPPTPRPSEKFGKGIRFESPKSEEFELTFSLDPNSPESLEIFTRDLGEINIFTVARGEDTRSFGVYATRDEILGLKDDELIIGKHEISNYEEFKKCHETFKKGWF
ncbi:hypothetical protein [Corynebacterium sp. H130]|uniref:hypothetical protein n=1 Tax=Corynebacterium sp. H130 TaxID=3133444 RepID=UPI0030B43481